jgi:hypothetical protein
MADLINTFSWSFSAAEDFEECRRRRYWSKYAMWNGWKETAAPLRRAAYRLGKMRNRYSLLGEAVERAVLWALRQKQRGGDAATDPAYESAARPYLNECWKQSRDKLWQSDPKKHCCLWEHYYGRIEGDAQKEMVDFITGQAKRCIANFIEKVLPSLAGVKREDEVGIARVGQGGDAESFDLAGVRVYAIPDYAYWAAGDLHIHDWKSGKPRETHSQQLAVYGLWANVKKGAAPERVHVYLQYLAEGATAHERLTEERLQRVREGIAGSVADMADYLEDGDIRRNAPRPAEEWELAADRNACRMCSFRELCGPELEET